MDPENSALPVPRIGRETLIPALVCAGVSVFFMRAGFLGFLFLMPLGLCAVVYGPRAAWFGVLFAIAGNGALALARVVASGMGMAYFGLDMLYFAVLAVGFTWIMTGNPRVFNLAMFPIPPIRTLFRFIAAAVAGVLAFFALFGYMIGGAGGLEGFSGYIRSQIGIIQQVFPDQLLVPDRMIDMFLVIIFRGGAMVSAFFLLFLNRLMVFLFARLFKRDVRSLGTDLIGFYAPRQAVWVLSLSLPVILLSRIISLGFLEIAAWNILVICAIMFLAQGFGVILFNLARRPMSVVMRFLCIVLLAVLVLSPGINVFVMGMVVLLGIVENWLPLRTMKN